MRLIFVVAFIGVLAAPSPIVSAQSSGQSVMEVYKSPTCGCCSKWVEHMQQHGFTARVTDLDDRALDAVKAKYGVPRTAQSCHTALVGGFAIEGHVPAAEVKRLLKEKPTVTGIAVAGMPLGSPGMEVPGRAQAYNVIAFDKKGDSRVFASYR